MSESAGMKESPPGLKNDDKHWSPPPLSPDGISGLPFSQPEPPPPGTPQSASSETNDGDKQIFTFKGPSGGDSTPAATESVAEVKVKDPHRSAFNGGDEPCWNFQNLENALAGEKTGETEEDDCDTKVAADAKKKVETANLFTINRASTTLLPRSPSAGGAASETHSPSARGAATESSGETFREMCDRASASMTGSPPRAPTSSAIGSESSGETFREMCAKASASMTGSPPRAPTSLAIGSTTESSVETFSEVCDRARAAARITVSSRVCTSNEVTSNEATTTGATATGPTTTESTTTESTTTEATATSTVSRFLSFALHLGGIAGIGGTAGSDADIGPQDGAPPGFVELIAGNEPPIAQAALNQMIAGLFVNAFMQQIGESDDDSNSEDHLSELQSTLGGNEFLDGPIDCTFERRNRLTWDAAGSVNNPFKVWHYPPPHSNILLPEFENVDRSVGRVPSLLSLSCKAVDEFFRLLKAEVLEDPRNSKLHLDTLATFPPSTIKTVIASLKWDQLCPIYLSFHPVISAYITDDVLDVTIANWETAYRKFYGERLYRNSSEGKKEIPRMNESLSPLAFAEFTAKHTPFANMIHLFGFERKKRADQVTPPSYFFTYGAWGGPVSQHYLKFSGTLLDEEKRMKENKEEERKKKRKAKPKELFPSKKEEPPAKHQPTPSQKEEPLLSKGTSEAAEGATSPPPSTPVIITTIEEARRPSSSPAHPLLEPLKQIFSNASEIEGKLGKISAVTCKSNWLKNWDVFTSGSLKGLNWKNVICAGGSVLACTMPSKKEEEGGQLTDVERKAWLCADPAWSKVENCERSPYADSGDIDIFLHSMTRRQANAKLIAIQKTIQANSYSPVLVVKTRHAVTFVQGFPRRHIQVVLRIYSCPAEVLMGFDLDASCVGFDGKSDVFMLPRAVRALNLRANVVDLSRRSLSYEARLAKYATRGFSVYVKELDAKRISPVLFDLPLNCPDKFKEIVGLGKLLLIEKARFLSGSPHRIPDRSQVITAKVGEARSSGEMYVDPLKFGYTRRLLKRPCWWMPKTNHGFSDEELFIAENAAIEGRDRAEKIQINDSLFGGKLNCDYSSIFLPFKEGYSVQKIKDLVSNIIFQKEWAVDNFDPSDWWEDESDDELETAMETCELIRAAPCVSMGFDISKLIHVRQWV